MTNLLPGFVLVEKLWSDNDSTFYHAKRGMDYRDVTLKILKDGLSAEQQSYLTNENHILQQLTSLNTVPKFMGSEIVSNRLMLILEYFPSKQLSLLIQDALDMRTKIEIAIALAQGLGEIHHHNVMHKDIKPANILVNEKNQIKYINFRYSSNRNNEIQKVSDLESMKGTLTHMSPEQTGRINRPLNYKTDIYSLGVTLYQLFTGRLPFDEKDSMELLYMQIAKEPPSPREINPEISEALSKVILKCLMKDSEERYNSAFGLRNDLEEILIYHDKNAVPENFTAGLRDVYDQFQIPKKLFGRQTELKQLFYFLDEVSRGKSELLLVKGYSGIGKSSLVNTLQNEVANKKGYFVIGKFDQYTHRQPFSGLIHALQNLVHQLLTENDRSLLEWKKQILDALKLNARLVTDYIPDLKLIIGAQPYTENLNSLENEKRLFNAFSQFIKVFTRQSCPLVLVLEDLQWADASSLKFLENILMKEMVYCLVIGTYRDNEVQSDHPLAKCLEHIREKTGPIKNIEVKPLGLDSIINLIAATLHCSNKEADTLAQFVLKKTQGNPFFINQYLKILYQEKLLTFDTKTQSWFAKTDEIEKTHVTDNVVDMMTLKMKTLPEKGQKALKIASAIGFSFGITPLSKVMNCTEDQAKEALSEALDEEFVLLTTENTDHGKDFVFQHDRIQQIAYQQIPEEDRNLLHYLIGKALLRSVSESHLDSAIINIAHHLNYGLSIPRNEEDQIELIKVNLLAGKKTKQAGFYSTAIQFFQRAIALLNQAKWKNQYKLSYELYENLAICQQVNGDVKKADETFDILLNQETTSNSERAKIYLNKITLFYGKTSTFKPIFELAKQGLSELGVHFEENPGPLSRLKTRVKLAWYARTIDLERIQQLPICTDEDVITLGNLYARLFYFALYSGNRDLMESLSQQLVSLTLRHGLTESGAYGFSCFTMIILGMGMDYQIVYKFAKLTLEIAKRFSLSSSAFDAVYPIYSQTNRCGENIKAGVEPLLTLSRLQQETGNYRTAALSASTAIRISLMRGDFIKPTLETINHILNEIDPKKTSSEYYYLQIAKHFCLALLGQHPMDCRPQELTDSFFKGLPAGTREHLEMKLCWHQFILDFINENFQKVETYNRKFENIPAYWPYRDDFLYYYALALAAQRKDRSKIRSIEKNFKKWSKASPSNYAHRYALLVAESARLDGKTDKAIEYYEKAIVHARTNEYQQDLALAYELLAEFHFQNNKIERAIYPIQQAYEIYLQWGALVKAKKIQEKYFMYLSRDKIDDNVKAKTDSATEVDMNTIIDATQTISREVSLDRLIEAVMRTIALNAGADKVLLILIKNDQLFLTSEWLLGREQPIRLVDAPLQTRSDHVPLSVINYVARSQKEILLNDALHQGGFENDLYIVNEKPLSILCIPINQQGKLVGLLYLENHLSKEIFTQDRIRLLSILSAQIAISIENAAFYTDLEEKVKSRTEDLQEALNRLKIMQAELVFQEKLKEREIMKHKFGKYIPNPKVLEDVLEKALPLGGEEKEVTILFCDIRDFTTLSEQMAPKQIVEVLNRYFTAVVNIVNQNHGIVDKFIGDAFMAIFGAVEAHENHASQAVQAAIDLQQMLVIFNNQRRGENPLIRVGVGINTGKVLIGNIGSEERLEYTAIGDNVNVASRVEGLTKTKNVKILITESTYRKLDTCFDIKPLGTTTVKGKADEISIYEVKVPNASNK